MTIFFDWSGIMIQAEATSMSELVNEWVSWLTVHGWCGFNELDGLMVDQRKSAIWISLVTFFETRRENWHPFSWAVRQILRWTKQELMQLSKSSLWRESSD